MRWRPAVASTDGVTYVPALLGLGTPQWDFGARGTLLGITRGSTRAHVVRAVLEGVAHRGADLVEAAEADTGCDIATIRVDGGMSANHTFVQALADASGRPVEVSPVAEATTRGAAFLAGLAVGLWDDAEQAAELWHPARRVEPSSRPRRAAGVQPGQVARRRRSRQRLDPRAVRPRVLRAARRNRDSASDRTIGRWRACLGFIASLSSTTTNHRMIGRRSGAAGPARDAQGGST